MMIRRFPKRQWQLYSGQRGEPGNNFPCDSSRGRREHEVTEDSSSWTKQGSPRTAYHYRESFGWRFGCKPLSLLLIGLLDSPSERMSSIWDSLQVRSPSAGFRV